MSFFIVNGCKKGCTNPNAMNYDSSAKEEDASCQYCDSARKGFFSTSKTFRDNNSSSSRYQDNVVRFIIEADIYGYQGNACKGKSFAGCFTTGSNDHSGIVRIDVANLTEDTIHVSGQLQLTFSQTENFTYQKSVSALVIPPLGQVEFDKDVQISCVRSSNISSITSAFSNSGFLYW